MKLSLVLITPSVSNAGERVIEGVFHQRARLDGNWEGYETIAASGSHACTLHWINNDGRVNEGDLLLLDAGIELDSLYTADVTRTLPVSGTFTPVQRKIYAAVLEAADAARAIIRPGITFGDVHKTAMKVIERYTREWGFLPDDVDSDVPYHKRYMVHGTSHHLGLDVHDCAAARREMYHDGIVEAGMGVYCSRAGALLPRRRSDCSGGVPWYRCAHRRRHSRDRERERESFRRHSTDHCRS